MDETKKEYQKGNYESIDLFFQDESSFSLITCHSRILTVRGVKPVGTHQHDYTYRWLWGAFSFLTGRTYSMYTYSTDKLFFIKHLEMISEDNPKRLNYWSLIMRASIPLKI